MEKRTKRFNKRIPIGIGDLLYSEYRNLFGIVIAEISDEAGTWLVYWNDGKEMWHLNEDIFYWKAQLYQKKAEIK